MTGQERQAQVRHIPILVEGRQELVRYSWSVRYQDSQPDRATTTGRPAVSHPAFRRDGRWWC